MVDLNKLRMDDRLKNEGKEWKDTKWSIKEEDYDRFTLTCPHCNDWARFYSYKEVKPIQTWKDVETKLEGRMAKIEKKLDDPQFPVKVARSLKKLIDEESAAKEAKEAKASAERAKPGYLG